MTLNTPKTKTSLHQKTLFDFLVKASNFKQLMPNEIVSFKATSTESFAFTLKGMPEIAMRIKEQTPYSEILFESDNEKIDFKLKIEIDEADANASYIQLRFEGKFSSMVSMMVKKPLKNFLNVLIEKMTTL